MIHFQWWTSVIQKGFVIFLLSLTIFPNFFHASVPHAVEHGHEREEGRQQENNPRPRGQDGDPPSRVGPHAPEMRVTPLPVFCAGADPGQGVEGRVHGLILHEGAHALGVQAGLVGVGVVPVGLECTKLVNSSEAGVFMWF